MWPKQITEGDNLKIITECYTYSLAYCIKYNNYIKPQISKKLAKYCITCYTSYITLYYSIHLYNDMKQNY